MKHTFRTMAAGFAAAALFTVSASAVNFTHCADTLSSMGLFQGTSSGYALDKPATRAEAATMLVRLLGKEEEAKTLTYTAPFTDLSGWEAPYVQYLYQNGLTSGTSQTTFSPKTACSSQMYAAFLLRALGYSEADGDFTYAQVLDAAEKLGVVDMVNSTGDDIFRRDNMVAMSYTALSKAPKSGENKTLLDQLVAEQAVDAEKAANVQKTFELYDTYTASNAALQADGRFAMDMNVTTKVTAGGQEYMTMEMPMQCAVQMNTQDLDQSKLAITGTAKVTSGGAANTSMVQDIAYYFNNGTYYMSVTDAEGAVQKIQMPMSLSDAMNTVGNLASVNQTEPISALKNITADGDTLHMEYAPNAMSSVLNMVLNAMDLQNTGMQFDVNTVSIDVTTKNGTIQTMKSNFEGTISVAGQSLGLSVAQNAAITATGDAVTVALPDDLNSYTVWNTSLLTK